MLLDGSAPAVRRWQQLSGPVAAKGVEDTAIYRFPALVSQNEVGADPGAAPLTTSALHRRLAARAQTWPGALTPLSTHDTKHSEDTRARIGVLAALSERYAAIVTRLVEHHDGERRSIGGRMAPSRLDELVLYQNLLGAWPLDESEEADFADRILAYMAKAAHEEKLRTSWTDPDEEYEAELARFATRAIETFRGDADPRPARAARCGRLVRSPRRALPDAAALRGTGSAGRVPGLRALEPGARRSRTTAGRSTTAFGARLLEQLAIDAARDGRDRATKRCARGETDASSCCVTARALHLRKRLPEVFERGEYIALSATGPQARHVIAFARRSGERWVIAVVPRRPSALVEVGAAPIGGAVWGETALALPEGAPTEFENALTGERLQATDGALPLKDALATLPVALLVA